MKNFKCLVLGLRLVLSGLLLMACGADKTDGGTDNLRGAVGRADLTFPQGMEISSAAFTGQAYLEPLIFNDEVYNFPQTNNVTFAPGARSSWHSHGGMIMLVTGGVG